MTRMKARKRPGPHPDPALARLWGADVGLPYTMSLIWFATGEGTTSVVPPERVGPPGVSTLS